KAREKKATGQKQGGAKQGGGKKPAKPLLSAARKLEEMALSKLPKKVRDALRPHAKAEGGPGEDAPPRPEQAARADLPATPPAQEQLGGESRGSGDDQEVAERAKLDLGPGASVEKPVEHIPWSYGQDRITAAAIDPDRLYAYWEVRDDSIERARQGLGPAGADAWLNVRVYDTSGLIFDGTNAHSYFDHRVDRSDRQWFFAISKPGSATFVDVGMKSTEGYFVKIVRSGRVDFPRKNPAPPIHEPEWLTVRHGTLEHAGRGLPYRGNGATAPAGGPHPPGPGVEGSREATNGHQLLLWEQLGDSFERVEWQEMRGGDRWLEFERHTEWEGPLVVSTWQAGPFTYPVEIEPPRREDWQGRSVVYKVGGVTHVVRGPWQVVIRNLGAHQERSILGRWEVYRSWPTAVGREVWGAGPRPGQVLRSGASESVPAGASERHFLAASELRLGGASELWRLGASELRFRGASETLFAGASQWLLRGASQLLLRGASERRLGGASERRLRGASEQRLGGASERRLGGASERRLGGASERRFGGASERIGGSEERLGARSQDGRPTPLPEAPAGVYPVLGE
ncbi:MAG TPA: DUF4912 domain-containing protein, partial [Anaeromyxobacteraceae bacterium]|nr:DUF4912 domain-containing protein [Anaeromyxobacteraceae bacterium]